MSGGLHPGVLAHGPPLSTAARKVKELSVVVLPGAGVVRQRVPGSVIASQYCAGA